jgi:hypothetical protein
LIVDMSTLLKQLLAKDSDFYRRITEVLRTGQFGVRALLAGSLVALSLAMLGWCGLLWPALRGFTPQAFVTAIFLGPAFTIVAVMDIRRSGWVWSRSIALACSLVAVALVGTAVYQVIHRVYAS